MMLRSAFSIASPAGSAARLSILVFHRVLAKPDSIFPNEMHAERFDAVCTWLSAWFHILPLDQALFRLQTGDLPARAACITFDDGYADNFQIALPILRKHRLTATFFIAAGFLDGGRMWNDSIIESIRLCQGESLDLASLDLGLATQTIGTLEARRALIRGLIDVIKYRPVTERLDLVGRLAAVARVALPSDLMMRSEEVLELRDAGMQIGAHTMSHPILARAADTEARNEIVEGKRVLENLLQKSVDLFAYPNGKPGHDYLAAHVAMVRDAGFSFAVTTAPGVSTRATDRFQLPRFTPWDVTRARFGVRLLDNMRRTRPLVA
jgi:peptidoglycan/xylan/chitin deacetylase (PgdA/CDA1 family)